MSPVESLDDERSQYLIAFEEAIATAEREGCTVVRGAPDTLLLDLDTQDAIQQLAIRLRMVRAFVGCKVVDQWTSRGGVGHHVVIKLDLELTTVERIVLQMALGSDLQHELLSLTTGAWEGNPEPSVLFRPPVKMIVAPTEKER